MLKRWRPKARAPRAPSKRCPNLDVASYRVHTPGAGTKVRRKAWLPCDYDRAFRASRQRVSGRHRRAVRLAAFERTGTTFSASATRYVSREHWRSTKTPSTTSQYRLSMRTTAPSVQFRRLMVELWASFATGVAVGIVGLSRSRQPRTGR